MVVESGCGTMTRHVPVYAALLMLTISSSPTTAQSPTISAASIPDAVQATLREIYANAGAEVRYFAGSINLDSEGYHEIIVHVVGQTVCKSDGCDTLVFTPDGESFRHVTTIHSTRPPIRVSPVRSHGWRNLIVAVSGGGARPHAHDVELRYDGTSYPSDPTTAPVRRAASLVTQVVIPAYGSLESGTLLAFQQ
jgi:hypothetical protein